MEFIKGRTSLEADAKQQNDVPMENSRMFFFMAVALEINMSIGEQTIFNSYLLISGTTKMIKLGKSYTLFNLVWEIPFAL